MRKKQFLIAVMVFVLVLPSFLVYAATQEKSLKPKTVAQREGEAASKDEVVYATLSALGEQKEIYVVNVLDVTKSGTILDYGSYSNVKNLTDLSEIKQVVDKISFQAPVGKFYYQGNMKDQKLPWNFNISYFLNGKEMAPGDLVGKEGKLEIKIGTFPNSNIDATFYENYVLQISLLLDSQVYSNLQAENATIAIVGKNKQVNFTALPEQEEIFTLKADVVDFEMEGIEIAALPYSMAIDVDVDVDGMTGDMKTLSDAIQKVNKGVFQLKSGISELNKGAKGLNSGSQQFKEGMEEIDDASSQIVYGSKAIKEGLDNINNSLSGGAEPDMSELENLPEELSKVGEALSNIATELDTLAKNYTDAHARLDQAMAGIPNYTITDQEITELYNSGADKAVVDKLAETYSASVKARETYNTLKADFIKMDFTLGVLGNSVMELAKTMDFLSKSLNQLQEGLGTLASNYEGFHTGLIGYTEGVSELSSSYGEFHTGITAMSSGTEELEKGVGKLRNGTSKLADSTDDLPEEMQKEIDKMISEFDKSDFEPVSFVSSENTNINSVQFVIKTEGIKKDEEEKSSVVEEEPKGFWARLWSLFF